jgi:hypothetical protein
MVGCDRKSAAPKPSAPVEDSAAAAIDAARALPSEITVREPKEGACAIAKATLAAERAKFGAGQADLEEHIRSEMCAAVGRTTWSAQARSFLHRLN